MKQPQDENDLRAILLEASRSGAPINVISTGRNWGYGSHLPSQDGTALIDLRAWNEIGPLDPATLSVRIQPGVTQGELHRWLQKHAPGLAFNTTGAGTQTSILGCALERGIGYAGPLDEDIFGLEVMLADGQVHRPDPEWFHAARDHAAGPSHDALFFQSNYGIVLAARLRLRVRQEKEQAVVLNGSLPGLLRSLEECYRSGILTLPTHISEPGRTGRLAANRLSQLRGRAVTVEELRAVFPERNEHVALTALHGRAPMVDAAWRELRRTLGRGVAAWRLGETTARRIESLARKIRLRNHADRLAAFLPLLGLTWGTPTDAGLHALALRTDQNDADLAQEGAIYGNAVSALTVAAATETAAIIRAAWAEAACTYIVLNAHCLVTVFTLHFSPEQTSAAKVAEETIYSALRARGYPPYRLGINIAGPAGEGLHELVKNALDPHLLLAPGRYEKQ
ncbi:MAG: FAD-dependent oxidoreductase [Opitutae bacterium]|nr:FAD-dependent oxidoreductase [Opitutae bacterium]